MPLDAPAPAGSDRIVPCLEVGGTHVTAALVALPDTAGAGPAVGRVTAQRRFDLDAVPGTRPSTGLVVTKRRFALDADAPADAILDALATAARSVSAPPGGRWGVAIPGPFDYAAGVGRFTGVGKFDALNGVDVGAALAARLTVGPRAGTVPTHSSVAHRPAPQHGPIAAGVPTFAFLNDATAFALGEWWAGAARGTGRAVAITLGTGTGACFLADGVPVTSGPDVPSEGVLHLLTHAGRPFEDHVSRRGLIAAHAAATGRTLDVHEIAAAARAGDPDAAASVARYYAILGATLDPWLRRFGAEVCVVGGSIARSWDLLDAHLRLSCPVVPAAHPEDAALLGAARWAST